MPVENFRTGRALNPVIGTYLSMHLHSLRQVPAVAPLVQSGSPARAPWTRPQFLASLHLTSFHLPLLSVRLIGEEKI